MKVQKISNDGIKALFNLAESLRNAIKAAQADGKINIADLPVFLGVLLTLPPAIQAVRTVANEVIDLDPAEVEEIKERLRSFSKDEELITLVGYLLLSLTAAFQLARK